MHGECPCDHSRLCDIWTEFQISRVSLEECSELLHGNWIEITRLRNYTDYLQELLEGNGIIYDNEFGALISRMDDSGADE